MNSGLTVCSFLSDVFIDPLIVILANYTTFFAFALLMMSLHILAILLIYFLSDSPVHPLAVHFSFNFDTDMEASM